MVTPSRDVAVDASRVIFSAECLDVAPVITGPFGEEEAACAQKEDSDNPDP